MSQQPTRSIRPRSIRPRWRRVSNAVADDRGTMIPLILGFWLLALLFVAGSVALGDAFTKQRELQSICDGAAIAGANSVDDDAVHGGGVDLGALPISRADHAVRVYLDRDDARSAIQTQTAVDADGVTLRLICTRNTHVAFGPVIGRSGGITQLVRSNARSPLGQ